MFANGFIKTAVSAEAYLRALSGRAERVKKLPQSTAYHIMKKRYVAENVGGATKRFKSLLKVLGPKSKIRAKQIRHPKKKREPWTQLQQGWYEKYIGGRMRQANRLARLGKEHRLQDQVDRRVSDALKGKK